MDYGKSECRRTMEYSVSSVFFDKENLVMLLSGFQKKTQKTPKSEIKRAERLKKDYYASKK
jgi:phage-related protein